MSTLRRAAAALIAVAALHAPGAATPRAAQAVATEASRASRIDAARLIKDLETLAAPAMQGRLTGTEGNKRAQAYLASSSSS